MTEFDDAVPFGSYAPAGLNVALIRISHMWPRPIARLAAEALKRIYAASAQPLDLEVEGARFRFYLADNYTEKKYAFTPWRYDTKERSYIRNNLPRDGVFVDIGANVGVYSLTAARQLGEGGRLLAFEPNPPTMARLGFNVEATRRIAVKWPAIELLPLGVSSKDECLSLHINDHNLGNCSIAKDTGSNNGGVINIQCRPLLDVLVERNVSKIDILKIDIEGAEDIALSPFLEKAPESLLPKHILIENSEHQWKMDLFGLIQEKGYRLVFKNRLNSVFRLSSKIASSLS